MTTPQTMEQCLALLQQSDDYQVLSKLKPVSSFNPPTGQNTHQVCIIDTETTGLDTTQCEIIELGYQIIEFDSHGNLYRVISSQNFLNEPKGEITPEVTRVTGLTMNDVKGHQIPWPQVEQEISQVQLCIAHNAGFDRPVVERYSEIFKDKIWGCSVMQIDWAELTDISSRSQEFLCWKIGQFFYNAHRALDDVQALCQLLASPISTEQKPALYYLLQNVRKSRTLIKATGAPFELKDALRQRGYRWNASERVWQQMIEDAVLQTEIQWLLEKNTPNPQLQKVNAKDTFSIRAQ